MELIPFTFEPVLDEMNTQHAVKPDGCPTIARVGVVLLNDLAVRRP